MRLTEAQIPKQPRNAKRVSAYGNTYAYDAVIAGHHCRWRYTDGILSHFFRYAKKWREKNLFPWQDTWFKT